MKKIAFVLAISINILTLSLIVMLSYLQYYLARLSFPHHSSISEYVPVPLVLLLIASFLLELYIILKPCKKETENIENTNQD